MSTRAVAAFAVLAALAPKMPEQCNKVLHKSPATTASAEPAPPPPPPPPSTATAPPIWTPPEAATPAVATTASGAATGAGSSSEYALAHAAAEKKDWKKVKSLLDKKVKSGRGSPEELELLHEACEKTRDKACLESLKKLYPADE